MHIKHIHETVEKLAECIASESKKGLKSVNTKEMGEVVDMVKDLCEAEYYAQISKAMKEADEEDEQEAKQILSEMKEDRRFYRGQPRNSRGEYMSGRRGRRRGYSPEMYVPPFMNGPVWDMDRDMDPDRMYFTGQVGGNMGNRSGSNYRASSTAGGMSGGSGSGSSSRYGYSHDEYMRKSMENKDGSPESKKKRRELFMERIDEIGEMLADETENMTQEEKQLWRSSLNKLINT